MTHTLKACDGLGNIPKIIWNYPLQLGKKDFAKRSSFLPSIIDGKIN